MHQKWSQSHLPCMGSRSLCSVPHGSSSHRTKTLPFRFSSNHNNRNQVHCYPSSYNSIINRPRQFKEKGIAEVLIENQRGWFLFGFPFFSANTLFPLDPSPWTCGPTGATTAPGDISSFPLPAPGWEWAWSRWYIDMGYDVDDQLELCVQTLVAIVAGMDHMFGFTHLCGDGAGSDYGGASYWLVLMEVELRHRCRVMRLRTHHDTTCRQCTTSPCHRPSYSARKRQQMKPGQWL